MHPAGMSIPPVAQILIHRSASSGLCAAHAPCRCALHFPISTLLSLSLSHSISFFHRNKSKSFKISCVCPQRPCIDLWTSPEAASLCTLLGLAGGTPPRCVWDAILRIRADGLASVNVEPILQLLGRVVFAGVERHISERVLAHMKGAVGNGGGGSGGAGALGILGRLEASLGAKT
jgi:hypothetical protein